jgi:hypothetical protein
MKKENSQFKRLQVFNSSDKTNRYTTQQINKEKTDGPMRPKSLLHTGNQPQ